MQEKTLGDYSPEMRALIFELCLKVRDRRIEVRDKKLKEDALVSTNKVVEERGFFGSQKEKVAALINELLSNSAAEYFSHYVIRKKLEFALENRRWARRFLPRLTPGQVELPLGLSEMMLARRSGRS